MKKVSVRILWLIVPVVFLAGYGFRLAVAQDSPTASKSVERLPADVHPETFSRMPQASRDEFTTDEDKQAYDHLIMVEPRFGKPVSGPLGGTGTRLHMPVVADAYRTAWNNMRDKSGVEPKYMELATLVACREVDIELEWFSHEPLVAKLDSPAIVEIVRNKQDLKGKGLEEKQVAVIQFGREMFEQEKVSSATFANMERLFGRKGTLAMATMMGYYAGSGYLFRAYDQHVEADKVYPFPDVLAKEKRLSTKAEAK